MNGYIQIKKQHSDKKDKDYISCILNVYGTECFINLKYETIMLMLDLKPSEVNNLPVGFESPKFEIKLGE